MENMTGVSFTHTERHKKAIFFSFQIRESKEKERLEKRLLEELFKMFMDSDSFYYSLSYDLTNSVQRQSACEKTNLPLWRKVSALCLFLAPGRWAAQWWSWSKPGRSRSTAAEHLVLSPARVQGNKSLQQHGLSCFIKSTDLSVWLQWINWWTVNKLMDTGVLPTDIAKPCL